MENFTLTNRISAFRINGQKEKMSAEILKVTLNEPVTPRLTLEVWNEMGFLIYAKPLVPDPPHPNALPETDLPEIPVNKRFIFSAFITLKIVGPPGSNFSATVQYV